MRAEFISAVENELIVKNVVIADGKKMVILQERRGTNGPRSAKAEPGNYSKQVRAATSPRSGMSGWIYFAFAGAFDKAVAKEFTNADQYFPVADFKFGCGSPQVQVVQYTLTLKTGKTQEVIAVSVWIDTKTHCRSNALFTSRIRRSQRPIRS